jgi:hypothetical protein
MRDDALQVLLDRSREGGASSPESASHVHTAPTVRTAALDVEVSPQLEEDVPPTGNDGWFSDGETFSIRPPAPVGAKEPARRSAWSKLPAARRALLVGLVAVIVVASVIAFLLYRAHRGASIGGMSSPASWLAATPAAVLRPTDPSATTATGPSSPTSATDAPRAEQVEPRSPLEEGKRTQRPLNKRLPWRHGVARR